MIALLIAIGLLATGIDLAQPRARHAMLWRAQRRMRAEQRDWERQQARRAKRHQQHRQHMAAGRAALYQPLPYGTLYAQANVQPQRQVWWLVPGVMLVLLVVVVVMLLGALAIIPAGSW